jgi:Rieske Fe-S protein
MPIANQSGLEGKLWGVDRRTIVKHGLGLGISLAFCPGRSLAQENPASIRPKDGDLLVRVDDATHTPLTPGDVVIGAAPIMVWAMDAIDGTVRNGSRLNRILLVCLDENALKPETRSRAAAGIVAYTAICTHTGCDVTDWLPEGQLYCPCHFTKFDPRDGAAVVDGPAPRPLPALPLRIGGGRLTVAGPFTARIAFQQE